MTSRRREDVVSGAPRRAPEAHRQRLPRRSPSASLVGFCVHQPIFNFLLAPTRARAAAGQQADLHAAGRGVLALHHRSSLIVGRRRSRRRSSCIRCGCSSRRVCTRTRSRWRFRSCCFTTIGFLAGAAFNHYVAFPFMMTFFASFNTPDLRFMPKLERRVRPLHEDAARHRHRVSDADGRVLPREDEAGDGALPAAATSATRSC